MSGEESRLIKWSHRRIYLRKGSEVAKIITQLKLLLRMLQSKLVKTTEANLIETYNTGTSDKYLQRMGLKSLAMFVTIQMKQLSHSKTIQDQNNFSSLNVLGPSNFNRLKELYKIRIK